ncbi:hypothetical protein AUJ68_03300 [Candidatus Woesearchaeota archaeon CG1_02_57_44]|nr:MAG: hypothetical protein AUJ68_03300 [Candidatus Woesearchaeota archaeon CG1_02_57_44]
MRARSLKGKAKRAAAGRLLVIACHPDDESIACGGTIAAHVADGWEAHVLVLTSDARTPGLAAIRKRECRDACEALGAQPPIFVDIPERRLSQHPDAFAAGVAKVLRNVRPRKVFLHGPIDINRDHRAAALMGRQVLRNIGYPGELYQYCVWFPTNIALGPYPLRTIGISSYSSCKDRAMACYPSQAGIIRQLRFLLRATNRVAGLLSRERDAEVFSRRQ